jgi:hypothetical protein
MPVHHGDMDIVGACDIDRSDFFAQFGEVGGQDGRRDFRGLLHAC